MFAMLASIVSSIFSTAMMGYLAMSTELGPWIAPIFIVVVMVFVRSFLYEKMVSKYVISIVTSASLGGMIGMCLGLSFPSFFFMHQKIFKVWLQSPIYFSLVVIAFIIAAAMYAFLLGYVLRHYFLVETERKFPMSQLVYDVLYTDKPDEIKTFAMIGIVVSLIINRMIAFSHFLSTMQLAHFNMYPLLASIGFISGQAVAIPVLIGLITRVLTFRLIHIFIPSNTTDSSLLVTFSMGMIIAWLICNSNTIFLKRSKKYWQTHSFLYQSLKKKWFLLWISSVLSSTVILLFYWKISILATILILTMIMLLAIYSIDIISTIGIIDIQTYVLFVLLGMIYFIPSGMSGMIAVSVLATLSLGIVVDLLFSYKLASLANVDHKFVTKYQIVGVVSSMLFAGIVFWYFCSSFSIQSYSALAEKTYQFEDFFKFAQYNPKVFFVGFFYGAVLHFVVGDLLSIIGGVLMNPIVSAVLVVSGAFANLIKEREKIYPVFLGIYAGHMLWTLLTAFK